MIAASWFYQKTNSYGEFVFDHEWADLYDRLGIPYYPKAVAAVPFTPATGSKLLGAPECHGDLLGAIEGIATRLRSSSVHHLFVPALHGEAYQGAGCALRTGVQFHWHNRNYRDFDEFLSALKKKRRKEINYERRNVDTSLEIRCLEGNELTSEYADFAYDLYQKTNLEKHSLVCLTRSYFQELFLVMRPYVRFFVAKKRGNGTPVAGALYLAEGDSMFGRYWGSVEEHRFLHFELCYYAPIELAIAQKVVLLEAGAQGSHKISRGFLPTLTVSAHQFFNSNVQEVFRGFCQQEHQGILAGLDGYRDHFPYSDENGIGLAGRRA